MQCQASDGEFTATVRWRVTSEQFYIEGYAPDSLSMTIRRPIEIDISEDAEMSYNFYLKGEHQLEGRVYYEDAEHSVFWQILVNSVLWWWQPA